MSPEAIQQLAKDEWEKLHHNGMTTSSHIVGKLWEYWSKAFEICCEHFAIVENNSYLHTKKNYYGNMERNIKSKKDKHI